MSDQDIQDIKEQFARDFFKGKSGVIRFWDVIDKLCELYKEQESVTSKLHTTMEIDKVITVLMQRVPKKLLLGNDMIFKDPDGNEYYLIPKDKFNE